MGVPASQMKRGMVIEHEGDLWLIVTMTHVKLSKGGGAMQTKLKNVKRGDHIQFRFRSSDKIEEITLEKKKCEYLYPEGEMFVFMDTEDYEQFRLHRDFVGEQMPFVKHNEQVIVTFHDGLPITVDLPAAVALEVIETEPGFKGDSVNNVFKPAKVETGLEIRVPNHITVGQRVKVSTETGEFIERA